MENQSIIKEIYDRNDFCLKFNKITVYRRYYGKEEQEILEYRYEEGDEDQTEISRYGLRRTYGQIMVWITFNKVDKLERLGIIDYHRTLPVEWEYEKEDNYDAVTAHYNGEISLMQITYQNNQHIAFFIINPPGVNDYYYRLMLSDIKYGIVGPVLTSTDFDSFRQVNR